MVNRARIDDNQHRLRVHRAGGVDSLEVVGEYRISNAHAGRAGPDKQCISGVVLEPAVLDDGIRIRGAASAVHQSAVVVAQFTVVHDQIRSSRGLEDAYARIEAGQEAGDD